MFRQLEIDNSDKDSENGQFDMDKPSTQRLSQFFDI